MRKIIEEISYIFNRKQKRTMIVLLAAIFIGAVFELLGVSLFTPLLRIISEPDKIDTNFFLASFRSVFGLYDLQAMFIGLAVLIILIYVIAEGLKCIKNLCFNSLLIVISISTILLFVSRIKLNYLILSLRRHGSCYLS